MMMINPLNDPFSSVLQEKLQELFPMGVVFSCFWRVLGEPADAALLKAVGPQESKRFAAMKSPLRQLEWAAGARCRLDSAAALRKLEILPERIRTAMTHTDGLAVSMSAAQLTPNGRPWGVGIDVESIDRDMQPGVLKRLLDDGEQGFGLSGVEAWTIKEAAWKAGDRQSGRVISQYRVLSWDSVAGHAQLRCVAPDAPEGFRDFDVVSWQALGFQFAAACSHER